MVALGRSLKLKGSQNPTTIGLGRSWKVTEAHNPLQTFPTRWFCIFLSSSFLFGCRFPTFSPTQFFPPPIFHPFLIFPSFRPPSFSPYFLSLPVSLPVQSVQHNGSIYIHVYFTKSGFHPDPRHKNLYRRLATVHTSRNTDPPPHFLGPPPYSVPPPPQRGAAGAPSPPLPSHLSFPPQ